MHMFRSSPAQRTSEVTDNTIKTAKQNVPTPSNKI